MSEQAHQGEHHTDHTSMLNWLRAAVLGANDGVVSTAGLVVGVAGATTSREAIFIAGVAGLAAGAFSMAAGEYVSVSTQRDTELALLEKERVELEEMPHEELAELTGLLREKGISQRLAEQVAHELTEHDALAAHAEIELGIDPENLTSPWHAAWASMIAFALGALLPLLVILSTPAPVRFGATFAAVVVALALTGWASAAMGGAPRPRAIARNVGGGMLAMVVTHLIGQAIGAGIG